MKIPFCGILFQKRKGWNEQRMGRLFILMGKSATGKDTVLRELLTRPELGLREIVGYTTRPLREKERDGVDYHFVSEGQLEQYRQVGRVLECRKYDTVYGPWYYFHVDDGQFSLEEGNKIMTTTLEGYEKIRDYFGSEQIVPLYLEISDRTRLHRALEREDKQSSPKYAELCRRFLADNEDFSEEELARLGIAKRYSNENLTECLEELARQIRK